MVCIKLVCTVYVNRYFIGSTTQAYVVSLNSTSSYSVEMSARGAALPLNHSVSGSQQVATNCSDISDCEMEFVSPLIDSWHYLTVKNWINETSVVNIQIITVGGYCVSADVHRKAKTYLFELHLRMNHI